ncbi:MAG: flagellar basal body-associated FliL family protein [Hyphomicrobiaceae bacterium]
MASAKSADTAAKATTGFLPALIVVVIMGAGAGFGLGLLQPTAVEPVATAKSAQSDPASGPAPADNEKDQKRAKSEPGEHILPLDPIIVNLSGANRVWLRLEGAVALSAPMEKERVKLVGDITEDLVGYLRGTSLAQLETANGLEFLREDMTELVRLRSNGRASRFLIRALVVE